MLQLKTSTPEGVWRCWHSDDVPIQLGVSSCLLGETVRYDGGHARSRYVTDVLGEWVQWKPVCPEVESGMSVPRPTIRLVERAPGDERLVAPATGQDFTESMNAFAEKRIADMAELDGFVVMKRSPSCGLERIRVYTEDGAFRHKHGVGVFTAKLMETHPSLPVEESGRLNDPRLRENFIERVFVRNRWRNLAASGLTRKKLVAFHTAHKLLARSHNESGYRRLGQIVASFGELPEAEIFAEYEAELHRTMRSPATTRKHTNVLQHALGYFKKLLGPAEKREVLRSIEDYRAGMLPLIVPLTLLRLAVVRHGVEYLSGQLYFDPHPKELMLRNHV